MLYDITVLQFTKMLHNLNSFLDKAAMHAETKKFDIDILLNSRLAPDQFNFIRQIQIACDTAKICVSKLTGKDAPIHEDTEKTFEEVRARIEKVIGYLKTFSEKDFEGALVKKVSQPRWAEKYLTGHEFVVQHAIPNFYFHITTAYAILR
ncbi:MAG: DUF1993 domain-containing protein, partial [Bdellovibrionota bacterium]